MRTKLPNLDGGRILRTYLRLMLAIVPATLAGWGLLHFWGPVEHAAALGRSAAHSLLGRGAARLVSAS